MQMMLTFFEIFYMLFFMFQDSFYNYVSVLFIFLGTVLIWLSLRRITKSIANYTEAKGLQNETLEEIRDLLIEIKEERANKR